MAAPGGLAASGTARDERSRKDESAHPAAFGSPHLLYPQDAIERVQVMFLARHVRCVVIALIRDIPTLRPTAHRQPAPPLHSECRAGQLGLMRGVCAFVTASGPTPLGVTATDAPARPAKEVRTMLCSLALSRTTQSPLGTALNARSTGISRCACRQPDRRHATDVRHLAVVGDLPR